jgi:hypothetical protein
VKALERRGKSATAIEHPAPEVYEVARYRADTLTRLEEFLAEQLPATREAREN